jgi:protein phosphatase
VFAVADGVGSQPSGGYAAERAVSEAVRLAERIQRGLARSRRASHRDLLAEIPARCQSVLRAEAQRNPEVAGMATTLTLALVAWPHAYVVHAGDSRCYRFHSGKLTRLTTDQTVAAELAAAGALSPGEAARSPMRNVLSSSVTSGSTDVKPESRRVALHPGDWLVLTTDGLHNVVPERDMAAILSRAATASAACRDILEAARAASAPDDATVVAVRLDGSRGDG